MVDVQRESGPRCPWCVLFQSIGTTPRDRIGGWRGFAKFELTFAGAAAADRQYPRRRLAGDNLGVGIQARPKGPNALEASGRASVGYRRATKACDSKMAKR